MIRRNAVVILAFSFPIMAGCEPNSGGADASRPAAKPLPINDWRRLQAAGWGERTGGRLGLWVSVARQELIGVENGRARFRHVCSTAAYGTGNTSGSNKTPLGWHEIQERFGDGLPAGAVFKERNHTGKVWTPDDHTGKDLILSRIMWLGGLERGVNAGPGIDSHARYIYIHGTPAEDKLGQPVSMGCIRLSNKDVIALYDRTGSGTCVLITEW